MKTLIIDLILVFLIVFALIPIIFYQVRRILREQKDYERGLKMVTLLINLPPSSEDIVANGRDARDIDDENISKAQTIYSILAGTYKKDFKSKIYGQRHFSFEIIGSKGFVNFYASVPTVLVDRVKQAIISAYPTSMVDEVPDDNIFSPIGKLSGTVGGELVLKDQFAYPIATYQELKRDPMQTILNSFSSLDKEDGAGIQFLLRPADQLLEKICIRLCAV